MKELKSITLSENISSIKRKISDFRNKKETPAGFSESEFQSLKNEMRSEIAGLAGFDSTDIPFIVTGHQPDFHHPGILFKDLLASRIANETGGKAIHLIV
ncbi:MAG: hypothetical protein K8R21_05345, partial [Leptospira sp.]|nr:hypothetical protein [Leptospira sp.]